MTKAKLVTETSWEGYTKKNNTRFNEIPMAMENYINDFNKKLEELGWGILSIDMKPGNIMLMNLKEVNGK